MNLNNKYKYLNGDQPHNYPSLKYYLSTKFNKQTLSTTIHSK